MKHSLVYFLLFLLRTVLASEIWGEILAFVDVNRDRFTDLVVKRDHSLVVYMSVTEEVDLKFTERTKFVEDPQYSIKFQPNDIITNVAAGDFNADSIPDLLVSTIRSDDEHKVFVTMCWGHRNGLSCEFGQLLQFKQQPLILNCDDDPITDFLAVELDGSINCYQGSRNGSSKVNPVSMPNMRNVTLVNSAHGFLDITGDLNANLVLQVDNSLAANFSSIGPKLPVFQVWTRFGDGVQWAMDPSDQPGVPPTPFPSGSDLFQSSDHFTVGHAIFDDFNRDGHNDILVPVCQGPTSDRRQKFWLLVWSSGQKNWYWLAIENFHNLALGEAGFHTFLDWDKTGKESSDGVDSTLVVRSGDYTQDGHPDLLLVLESSKNKSQAQAFFIENVACNVNGDAKNCTPFGRTFKISFSPLTPCSYVKTATFFDLGEDGTLDLLYECRNTTKLDPFGFSRRFDYNIEFTNWNTDHDTTFLKVQTYTPACDIVCPDGKETGVSWPGVALSYTMVDTEGYKVNAAYTQQSRTSHKALLLPYALFGLGRSPNFVETLNVGVPQFPGVHQTWPQIVPNSRMYVVPHPVKDPSHWVGRLYVTPSRLILLSVSALGGVCLLILITVVVLQCYEMRQDKKERDVLKKRFHFDAM